MYIENCLKPYFIVLQKNGKKIKANLWVPTVQRNQCPTSTLGLC